MVFAVITSSAALDCTYGDVYDPATGKCQMCTVGYYSDEKSSAECKPMPAGTMGSDGICTDQEIDTDYWYGCTGYVQCKKAFYCPGGQPPVFCPAGSTTATTGAKSIEECNVCLSGYTLNGSACTACAKGTYKSGEGSGACQQCAGRTKYASSTGRSSCSSVSAGYYTTGCNGSGNACTGQSECGIGYYCTNGVRYSCGENETTTSTKSTSAGACVCKDGATRNDAGKCELSSQPCPYGFTTLRTSSGAVVKVYGDKTTTHAIAIQASSAPAPCYVKLQETSTPVAGAIHVTIDGKTYYAID